MKLIADIIVYLFIEYLSNKISEKTYLPKVLEVQLYVFSPYKQYSFI